METKELLIWTRKIMHKIEVLPEQGSDIDKDLARQHDEALSEVYQELENFQDAIDPGHYFRDELANQKIHKGS